MDLEEFERSNQILDVPSGSGFQATRDALDHLDQLWVINATRSARWMDLLGDYAGDEPFIIDGRLELYENYCEIFSEINIR
jgi:ATP-dependent RNA helicase DDX60